MQRVLPYALAYIYGVAVVVGVVFRGPFVWLPVILTFVAMPLLDATVGISLWNPDPADETSLTNQRGYRFITWAWVPFEAGAIAWALWVCLQAGTTWPERIGLAVGVGLMNGVVGITYAHELIHQSGRFERFLGDVLLALATYSHFRVEHVFGHHRHVATPADPATARTGETFYAFFVRSVPGQLVSAWQIEGERLRRQGKPIATPRNRMLQYAVLLVVLYAAIFAATGALGIAFFAVQSLVAFVSLEIVNYIEHYGLRRARKPDGRYETVRPAHSWNTGFRMSNWLLINLARHSDHHAVASRRFQILRSYDAADAPMLPFGYATMYLIALAPPLWFRVMQPRLLAWQATSLDAALARADMVRT